MEPSAPHSGRPIYGREDVTTNPAHSLPKGEGKTKINPLNSSAIILTINDLADSHLIVETGSLDDIRLKLKALIRYIGGKHIEIKDGNEDLVNSKNVLSVAPGEHSIDCEEYRELIEISNQVKKAIQARTLLEDKKIASAERDKTYINQLWDGYQRSYLSIFSTTQYHGIEYYLTQIQEKQKEFQDKKQLVITFADGDDEIAEEERVMDLKIREIGNHLSKFSGVAQELTFIKEQLYVLGQVYSKKPNSELATKDYILNEEQLKLADSKLLKLEKWKNQVSEDFERDITAYRLDPVKLEEVTSLIELKEAIVKSWKLLEELRKAVSANLSGLKYYTGQDNLNTEQEKIVDINTNPDIKGRIGNVELYFFNLNKLISEINFTEVILFNAKFFSDTKDTWMGMKLPEIKKQIEAKPTVEKTKGCVLEQLSKFIEESIQLNSMMERKKTNILAGLKQIDIHLLKRRDLLPSDSPQTLPELVINMAQVPPLDEVDGLNRRVVMKDLKDAIPSGYSDEESEDAEGWINPGLDSGVLPGARWLQPPPSATPSTPQNNTKPEEKEKETESRDAT